RDTNPEFRRISPSAVATRSRTRAPAEPGGRPCPRRREGVGRTPASGRAVSRLSPAGNPLELTNRPGVPGGMKLAFLPNVSLRPGPLGMMSKSGTLSYETGYRLATMGLGQSIWVGVGGDPVKGLRFPDLLDTFLEDERTKGIVLVGEIGGSEEEDFADALMKAKTQKPVYALVAGRGAKEGVAMGHAGALVYGNVGTFASKKQRLEAAGARVFATIEDLIETCGRDHGGR